MAQPKTILTVIGTRPEAIKLAPVVRELARHPSRFKSVVVITEQHLELLHQALASFDLQPDIRLHLMEPNQGLAEFAAKALDALSRVLTDVRPDMVLVQGDTTTVVTAALAAFYQRILVGHVEAGLRSFDRGNPFPEEINRRLASVVADLHFAPTEAARQNLLALGVPSAEVLLTGNTIVDALHSMHPGPIYDDPSLGEIASLPGRAILVTAHRRENHGRRMHSICTALIELTRRYDDVQIIWPVHPNPNVREMVESLLAGRPRIHLVSPTSYQDIIRLMKRSYIIMSDSGGIQEEAPSLGKPLLVLRDVTERTEVVEAGAARLVGASFDTILEEVDRLFTNQAAYDLMRSVPNPFGDGHAARRIVAAMSRRLHDADYIDYAFDPVPKLTIPRISGDNQAVPGTPPAGVMVIPPTSDPHGVH